MRQHPLVTALGRHNFAPGDTPADGDCAPLAVLQTKHMAAGMTFLDAKAKAQRQMPKLRRQVARLLRMDAAMATYFALTHEGKPFELVRNLGLREVTVSTAAQLAKYLGRTCEKGARLGDMGGGQVSRGPARPDARPRPAPRPAGGCWFGEVGMRAMAIVLRTPIIVVTALAGDAQDLSTVVYPADGDPHRLVNPSDPRSARRRACQGTAYRTQQRTFKTAADVAFDARALVVMFTPNHYYCTTRLPDHDPDALRDGFLKAGGVIFPLL